jgi:hypothetical protein
MLERTEILYGLVLPAVVSALIAGVGAWRRWGWAMPLAAGVGFLASYGTMSAPRWRPSDGFDWLFWLAIPATFLGVLDAATRRRWGWLLGAAAGAVAYVLVRPLSAGVEPRALWAAAAAAAVAGVVLAAAADVGQRRVGSMWTVGAFAVAMAGAGVMVFSSNFRTFGVYGLAAAAALGPVVVAAARTPDAARGVAIVAGSVMAGLLVAGRFYADPGVTWANVGVLLAAPALLLVGAAAPTRRAWVRGVIGVLATAVAVGAVTGPAALEAKKAAETVDPYDAYR